jgi:hypothetical protein
MVNKSKNHWHLSLAQWLLITLISLSPTLGTEILVLLFGNKSNALILALLPALPFLGFGWVGGIALAALFPNPNLQPLTYYTGFSVTVFVLAYLCLVNWKYHRAKKKANQVNETGGAIHPR